MWLLTLVLIISINTTIGEYMADDNNSSFDIRKDLSNYSATTTAIDNVLNQAAARGIDKLRDKNPILGDIAGGLLGQIFPGFGGTQARYGSFQGLVNERVQASLEEQINDINSAVPRNQDVLSVDTGQPHMENYDWRARLRPKKGGEEFFYNNLGAEAYLMKPLQDAGGMVWQTTPQIFLSGTSEFNSEQGQGMNYPIQTFNKSIPPELPIAADFYATNNYEARYLLAVLTFIKIASKGFFGDKAVVDGDYGTPPPVLLFEYLGEYGFNKIPVVITNYTIQYPDDVDYVPVTFTDKVTYVPARSNIMVNLSPAYTPHRVRRNFSLHNVANGTLPGFI